MTQHPQTQPVESPENPGLLRRSFEAVRGLSPVVRGLPPVMGAEMAARGTADKLPLPTRNEALAIGAAVVVASGAAANGSPAGAQTPESLNAQAEAEISAAEGSRQVVKTSLSKVPGVRTSFIWKRNKNGKKVPTRKIRVKVSNMPGHPGDWDLPPADFLDRPVTLDVSYVSKRKGSDKSRKRRSNVGRLVVPSHLTRLNPFDGQVVLKLRKRPNLKQDDWAINTRKTVDPIVGGPQSKDYTTEKYRPKYLGPIT